ncbi:MAG: single-stranded-DNA-specific exonuclease RecJ [Clostridia bacterium]|nr:single-stranded-DNA-specific exonuclease RecJ [Clostridia bacterium]
MFLRQWRYTQPNTDLASELAEICELNPVLALLLVTRGITTPEEAFSFLVGQEEEADPYDFADMDAAVCRVRQALEKKEKILVYGDYDVDGITATVLLYTYLRRCGADVVYRVPKREEGYGLHEADVLWAAEQGVDLIVTVDNGVSLIKQVTLANEKGIDVVVTDHHQPPDELPPAVAVVDPCRADCESPCKDYAGVGVAFMLVCALEGDGEAVLSTYGDLLTLGTIGDVMPLTGFMRDLMRRGIRLLDASSRPGILALRRVASCEDKELTARTVSFSLVPRINAAGRMGDPDLAVRLLLTEDIAQAQSLAETLEDMNARRQTVSNEIYAQVQDKIAQNPEWLHDRVLVVDGEGWHGGVLGIIAARLTERYGKPTFVLSVGEDGVAHGSGRSLEGFSIYEALKECEDRLIVYGGHELAAGVTLYAADIDAFRCAINASAASSHPVMPVPKLDVAIRLRPEQVSVDKLVLLEMLEPCGAGNPSPQFGLFRMRLDNIAAIGGGKHMRLSLSRDGVHINAVKFQMRPEELPIPCGSLVNCIVSLEKNVYHGNISVSVRIIDIGYADTDRAQMQAQIAAFEDMMRCELRPAKEDVLPSREQLAHLYSMLHACGEWNGTVEHLHRAVNADAEDEFTVLKLLATLEIWREASLVEVQDLGDRLRLRVLPTTGKTDLSGTALWRYLEGE